MNSFGSLRLVLRTLARPRPNYLGRGAPRAFASTQQPVQYAGRDLTDEVLALVEERDATLRHKYDKLPEAFPASSQPPGGEVDHVEAFRKRLVYRSKQRGWYVTRRR